MADLLWVALGAAPSGRTGARPGGRTAAFPRRRSWEGPYEVPWSIRDLIPEPLRTSDRQALALPGEAYEGPDLVQARALTLHLRRSVDLLRIEPYLQRTYAKWHDERDRDLIHFTGDLSTGLRQAIAVIRVSSGLARQEGHSNIGRLAWAHATFAVDAEARICRQGSKFLVAGVDRARPAQRLRGLIVQRFEHPDWVSDSDEDLAKSVAELVEANTELEGYYRHGGMTSPESVNTAGERLIAAQLHAAAQGLSEIAHEMAATPSFEKWLQSNPDVASNRPLLPTSHDSL